MKDRTLFLILWFSSLFSWVHWLAWDLYSHRGALDWAGDVIWIAISVWYLRISFEKDYEEEAPERWKALVLVLCVFNVFIPVFHAVKFFRAP